MSRLRFTLLAVLILSAATLCRAEELRTLSGKSVAGTLTNISDTEIIIKTDAGPVATPIGQALMLDLRQAKAPPAGTKYYDVRLLDDTSLMAKDVTFAGKDAQITLLSGTTLKLPVAYLVWILKDADDAAVRKQWTKLLKTKTRRDRVMILKDGDLNALEGSLGEVDAAGDTIEFKRDSGETIKVRFKALHGLTFYRTDIPAESAVCKVVDQDGNTLAASKLAFDGKKLTVTTTFGGKVELPQETLARLDFNIGRLTYLSDLSPAKIVEPPFFGGFPALHVDKNQDGRPIVLKEKNYPKGLSLEGGAAVEYDLAGKYKEFKALIGVDTRTGEGVFGKTTLNVYCDGEKRFSQPVSPKDVRPIAVNVKDVGTLRIVVEGPDLTGYTAYVTLAEARVSQ